MPDRRNGTSRFWDAFWQFIYGERRKDDSDRRKNPSPAQRIVYGCGGSCLQGRKPCDCPLKDRQT